MPHTILKLFERALQIDEGSFAARFLVLGGAQFSGEFVALLNE